MRDTKEQEMEYCKQVDFKRQDLHLLTLDAKSSLMAIVASSESSIKDKSKASKALAVIADFH